MNTLSNDIKEYAMTFSQGLEKGNVALAAQLDPNVLIGRIKELNPSFSLLSILSQELEKERRMMEIKRSISYKFYEALNVNDAFLSLIPSYVTNITPEGIVFKNIIQVEIDDPTDIEDLLGKDLTKDATGGNRYFINTGENCMIKNRVQFLNDLAFIKSYRGDSPVEDITEINI